MTSPPNQEVGYTENTFTITSTAFTYVFDMGVDPNYGFFPPHKNLPGIYSKVANVYLTIESRIDGGLGNGLSAAGIGVDLTKSATLGNTSAGYIIGGLSYDGYVNGSGFVKANGGIGVSMAGGTLTNDAGGIIKGGALSALSFSNGIGGAGVSLSNGTLDNSGKIYGGQGFSVDGPHGTGGDGVDLSGGAALTNTTSGYIYGGFGLYSAGVGINASGTGTTLVNDGRIKGAGVYSNAFHGYKVNGSGAAGVILSSGATLSNLGSITGGSGPTTGVAAIVKSGGTLKNEDTGTAGVVTVAAGGTVTNTGNLGAVDLNGGTLTTSPSSTIGISSTVHGVDINGGTLTTSSYIDGLIGDAGADIQFGSAAGTMKIESGATFGDNAVPSFPNIDGFAAGDVIDITYLSPSTVKGDFNQGTHTLSNLPMGTLEFGGTFAGETFAFNAYGAHGTQITLEPACYLRGTQILTGRGQVAIEELKIGDTVMTAAGVARPIRWIGRRRYSRDQLAADPLLLPVRISAGALADGVPKRDLWLSPEHALFIDGMLIPASALINGASINQERDAREATYFHLEFDSHEVIMAEGAPAESFVDDESRGMFDNAHEFDELYPTATFNPARLCAPRIEEGFELAKVRERLARRASIPCIRTCAQHDLNPELRSHLLHCT